MIIKKRLMRRSKGCSHFMRSQTRTRVAKLWSPFSIAYSERHDILVAEDFKRKGGEGFGIAEQIDGVVEIDNQMYLVEMKWWDEKLGPAEVAPHINRLLLRNSVGGIFISSSDFTPSALETCRDFLQQRVLILCTLREIVDVLNREADLRTMLQAKIRAAKLERNPLKRSPEIAYRALSRASALACRRQLPKGSLRTK